jgi:glucosyl-3-phosphoglycerate synthase
VPQFSYRHFLPLQNLVERKTASGSTVSLVIPALNEAATVGTIVASARKDLMEEVRLLDEILVMDGGSSDNTRVVAANAGATVHASADIKPHLHFPGGKGTSLWKSQFVAKGSILVYVDADITNFASHFVYGLVGALLGDARIACAKAYYERPLVVGGTRLENQGGRVTEILVRPLLSIWFPELARFYQPLSGEYAFRRECLQQIPFSSGYGVEIRLLLSAYKMFGMSRIAQVDMGLRLHRNRTVSELGRMSHAILLEFFRLLRQEGRISWAGELGSTAYSPTSCGWEETAIHEAELPAADTAL